jgi:hypothetical protein
MELTSWQKLDKYFSKKSMMEIMGVDRDENAHSNFLAWLFENEETGKHACKLLIELLQQEAKKADKKGKEKVIKRLENLANISIEKISKVKVVREDYICLVDGNTKMEGRCDVVIIASIGDLKYRIIIENKVKSEEKNSCWKEKKEDRWCNCTTKPIIGQTQFYYNYYSPKEDYENIYIFLTLPNKPGSTCIPFFHIDYQNIMDDVLIPIKDMVSGTTLIQIDDYIKALGINYSQDEVMAVSPELETLVNQLLGTNDVLNKLYDLRQQKDSVNDENEINRLIEFWNHYTNTGVAYRDILRPFFEVLTIIKEKNNNAINKDGRDDTKYRNGNEVIDGKNPLFRWIVEKYIVERLKQPEPPTSKVFLLEELQLMFPPSLHGKTISAREGSCTNNNIILGEQKSKFSNIYEDSSFGFWRENKNRLADGIYICQTGWDGPAMMSRLIKYVKENIPLLENLNIQEIPFFLQ